MNNHCEIIKTCAKKMIKKTGKTSVWDIVKATDFTWKEVKKVMVALGYKFFLPLDPHCNRFEHYDVDYRRANMNRK